ncbi:MAG: hypothetical protein P4L73_03140 [Caulobacteraceae bacterium]|nr:hypothetical protein [Caulobacteraceae bacterium]
MQPSSRSSIRVRLAGLIQVVLAAAILLWPAFVAGRPTVFADDGGYWRLGRIVVVQGLGLDRTAPDPFDLLTGAQVVDRQVIPDPRLFSTFAAARSASYGVFLFATQQIGTLWLTVALQALAVAASLRVLWRAAAPRAGEWTYLAMIGALAAFSSLALFTSFAMPDVFAGLAILAMVGLGLYWDRLDGWRRLALWSLLAASLSVHASHLLVGALVLPAAALALWRLGAPRAAVLTRLGALAAAIGAAGLLGLAGTVGVSAVIGAPAHSPPFLTARLLADGPGRTYLRRACARAEPFFLCRFKDRPLDKSDQILWSNSAQAGVFTVSDVQDRLRLEAEAPRFVRAVILADPGGVALAALRDFGRTLGGFYVDDPLHDPCETRRFWYWNDSALRVVVPDAAHCPANAGLFLSPWPLYGSQATALILAVLVLWRLARERARGRGADDERRLLAAAGVVAAAVVVNAAVCGVLSGPFARYEARLIWLVPLLGLLAARALAERRSASARESAAGLDEAHRAEVSICAD